jgi:hypothetical protein
MKVGWLSVASLVHCFSVSSGAAQGRGALGGVPDEVDGIGEV